LKRLSWAKRGGAVLALPLLLWFARPASADVEMTADAGPHLDATGMMLIARPEALDDAPKGLGFPTTGSQVALYGGGAGFSKGALNVEVQALVGGLTASLGDLDTEWRLRFGNVLMEQRYPYQQFLFMGGAVFTYGQVESILTDDKGITRYDGLTYGGGVVASARWPRATRLGFTLRTGYEWLPVTGIWKGEHASVQPKSSFDLGGPLGQLQLELSF
jgi:hypothetical protein